MKIFVLRWQGPGWYALAEDLPDRYGIDLVGRVKGLKPANLGAGYLTGPKWVEDPEEAFRIFNPDGQVISLLGYDREAMYPYLQVNWRGPGWYAPVAGSDTCYLEQVSEEKREYPETYGLGLGTPEWYSSIFEPFQGYKIEEIWQTA